MYETKINKQKTLRTLSVRLINAFLITIILIITLHTYKELLTACTYTVVFNMFQNMIS